MSSDRITTAVMLFPLMASLHFGCSPPEIRPSGETRPPDGISHLLPQSGELENWTDLFSPQQVVGEDLYTLIDGGAEIYHEYGFRQAVHHSYESVSGRSINVEIYEMDSPESAYGIYSFKTGDEGEEIPIGNDGLLESYYLNFWKANYLVTVVGFDPDRETVEGLLQMARQIDAKIEDEGSARPNIVRYLPKEGLNASTVVYLKGNIALQNNYEFDSENIFGVEEGVIGEYGDSKVFLFNYESAETAWDWFQNGRDQMRENPNFSDFVGEGNEFTATDASGHSLLGKTLRNTIVIVWGSTGDDHSEFIDEISNNIARNEQGS